MTKLDASNVRRLICDTNKGKLELCALKGGNQYYLTLDSVPLELGLNLELMQILFPVEIPQAKFPPVDNSTMTSTNVEKVISDIKENKPIPTIDNAKTTSTRLPRAKKIGRPKGSKTGDTTMQ